ncbi:MAG TPA: ATP-binding cassette domain-containing protein, partial [Actinomycetes bacterium]|nr:ATP-binding cassette domain-containing protein [Actinomycetes bacterium]
MTLLDVQNLTVDFHTVDGVVRAVRNTSFSVAAGQTLGVVGESGSGKSVTVQSLLGLARGATVTGTAKFNGADLLTMKPDDLRRIRGAEIGMVFQDPLQAFNPVFTVGFQTGEVFKYHTKLSAAEIRQNTLDLFARVGLDDPMRVFKSYPHQL